MKFKFKLLASSAILAGALIASGSASASLVGDVAYGGSVTSFVGANFIDTASSFTFNPDFFVTSDPTGNGALNNLNKFADIKFVGDGGNTLTTSNALSVLSFLTFYTGPVALPGAALWKFDLSGGTWSTAGNDATHHFRTYSGTGTLENLVSLVTSSADISFNYTQTGIDPQGSVSFSGTLSAPHQENIPEPMMLSLLGLGLAAFGFNRRRNLLAVEGQSA